MTQAEKVLSYIEKNGSIDAWRAQSDLRILRLSARIFDLRKAGVDIVGIIRTKDSEDGRMHWMEYRKREPLPAATGNDSGVEKMIIDSTSDNITNE